MSLTPEQSKLLTIIDKTGMIKVGDRDKLPGLHFCHEWDSQPICKDSPEWDACICDLPKEESK